MNFRNSSAATNDFPSPASYGLGSPESRAAAQAMADAKREPPQVMLLGKRTSDGKPITILIYKGGHTETKEMK
jgi:hypothetical protein